VASWASLFQNEVEGAGTCATEIGQYSCMKLLKEMEAIESDADDEIQHVSLEDMEMMELPKDMRSIFSKVSENKNLSANLYVIPDRMALDQVQEMGESTEVVGKGQGRKPRDKWGPMLVEPRPTRVPRDGRTMLEKAQDRKNRVNLENSKGINKDPNPFSMLTASEIIEVAECVDICLGKN
jgi:hypothetical protein